MAPSSGLDTDQIKDKARKDLLALLEGVQGKKNLVLERSLAGPIGVFVKFSTLQDYGVDKVFWLENGNVDSSQRNVVFLARGDNPTQTQTIAEQVKKLQRKGETDHEFSIFWAPRRTLVCNKILENEGVLGDVSVSEFPLFFVPLEKDVLSLELPDSFRDLYLRKNPTPLFHAAQALMLMQQHHGLFPRIIGKGDNARRLTDLLLRMRSEIAVGEKSSGRSHSVFGLTPSSTIESIIIIDREVDFATVLLTQLTYEGLIDELVGIQNNQAEVDTSIVGSAPSAQQSHDSVSRSAPAASPQQTLKRKIQLDSNDKLYEQLRDANFAIVGGLLNKVARRLESDYESRHTAKSTSELREFVNKLPGYQAEQQSLKIHTGLAEDMMKNTKSDIFSRVLEIQQNLAAGTEPSSLHEMIEELIARNTPLPVVLRLVCLESCISGGLRPKDLENFKRQIVHAYGFQHLLTLDSLDKLRLLHARASANPLMIPTSVGGVVSDAKTNYNYLRKALRLIVDEVNEQDPNDIAYVYSGYAPLSVRLVQCVLQKQFLANMIKGTNTAGVSGVSSVAQGWRGFEEAVKNVRGRTIDEVQSGEDKAVKARQILNGHGEKRTVLAFFLGGITFTEIAALRFIAKQEDSKSRSHYLSRLSSSSLVLKKALIARRRIIIGTTSIISGNSMMASCTETANYRAK
ncbi:MAG: hypothetical protein M1836_003952 [Candelina mexicana]|nr:MAG: hypothetical protein M1836_003952 [Candelina mexicana]